VQLARRGWMRLDPDKDGVGWRCGVVLRLGNRDQGARAVVVPARHGRGAWTHARMAAFGGGMWNSTPIRLSSGLHCCFSCWLGAWAWVLRLRSSLLCGVVHGTASRGSPSLHSTVSEESKHALSHLKVSPLTRVSAGAVFPPSQT
jgi:hypothetical protein